MARPQLPHSHSSHLAHTGITPAPPYSRPGSVTQLSDILAPNTSSTENGNKGLGGVDYSAYTTRNVASGLRPTTSWGRLTEAD